MKKLFSILCISMLVFSVPLFAQNMVGSLGGDVAVSHEGLASYSIPIDLVPGTKGVQPNLAITYSSAGGRGLLGSCWTLAGLSSISRTPRDFYHDGDAGSVNFDSRDRYALDGARLVRLSTGAYATAGAVYGKKVEDFSRVTLHGTPNTRTQYFTAVTADGTVVEYGNVNGSKQLLDTLVLAWWVDKVTDPDGNSMDFHYTVSSGEMLPGWIDYTYNTSAGLTKYASVVFAYTDDPNPNKTWVGGKPVTATKLLSGIEVKYNSTVVRRYAFEYAHDRSSRLTAVVLKDGTGNELTRTSIGWGSDGQSTSFQTVYGLQGYTIKTGDFTGDNLTDLLLNHYDADTQTTTWSVRKGDGEGHFSQTPLSGTIGGGCSSNESITVADFDGNGIDEIGYTMRDADSIRFHAISFTGYSHQTRVLASNKSDAGGFLTGRFLGTGGLQVLRVGKPVGNTRTLTCLENGTTAIVHKDARLAVTDVNGNGKSEIQAVGEHDVKVYEYDAQNGTFAKIIDHYMEQVSYKDFFGDLNGDGYTDYIYFTEQGFYLKMSKGNDYCPSVAMPFNTADSGGTPRWPLLVGDLNGDGRDDAVQPIFDFYDQKLTLYTYITRRCTSDGWLYDTLHLHNPGVTGHAESMFSFAELNGDGKAELFYSGSIFHDPVIISLPEGRAHDLALSFTDGYGKATAVAYGFYGTPDIGYLGLSGRRVRWPLAKAVSEPDGNGGTAVTFHSYGEAINDSLRGLLGFRYHEAYSKGTCNKYVFLHDTVRHRIDLEQSLAYFETKDPGGLGGYIADPSFWNPNRVRFYHRETANVPAVLSLSFGRTVPYDSVSSDIDRLRNTVRTVSVQLGSDGRKARDVVRMRQVEAAFGDWLELDSTVYAYATVTLPNGKQVKKPSSVKAWHRRNGFGQSPWHLTSYAYTSGRLSTVTVTDSDGTVGSTSYSYNAFGLPLTETLAPYGMDAMTTGYAYDGRGRFVTRVTDPLGNIRTSSYDQHTGLPLSETDINGLATSFQYDALGRVIRVTRPDGTVRNTAYAWNATSAFGDAVWYVRTTEDGLPETKVWFDVLGRKVHSFQAGRGYDDTVYDSLGLPVRTTFVPYSSTTNPAPSKTWSETSYDCYGRTVAERGPYTRLSYTYYDPSDPTQNDFFVTVFDSIRNTQRTRTYDAAGRVVRADDAGGTVAYSYGYTTRSGRILDSTAVACGGATVTMLSDIRGHRVSIQDPDAGTVASTYDVLGRVVSNTDANGVATAYAYDLLGRVTLTVRSDGAAHDTVSFVYDSATGKGKGRIHRVRHNGADETVYGYDNLGRLSEEETIDGLMHYVQRYSYDALGRLESLTYPDGFAVRHSYNGFGELALLADAATDSLLYAIDTRDKFRHPLKCRYGNGTGVEYSYNGYGLLTGIRNGDVTDGANIHGLGHDATYTVGGEYRQLSYTYDDRGFVASRSEANAGQSEAYSYDALDRLVSHTVNGVTAATLAYDGKGNIASNSRVGSYSYYDAGPHAVTGIAGVAGCPIPNTACDVTYGLWNRPSAISENGYVASIDYGADGMRRHTRFLHSNILQKTVTRVSGLHEVETTGSTVRSLDYVFAEGGVVAVHVANGSADSIYYVLTDRLGSWETVMDDFKNTVQQTHFDPWGNRMSYTAWNTPQTQVTFPFSRGFTGHEHYDRFKIVNANARLYDPVIGRFFSPDPFVQVPDFTQSYNRYSYCMNNPVMYSDPDGEFLGIPMLGLAFIADLTSNLINGVDHPVQTAWNNASATVKGMDQCLQFSVPLGENTCLSFGISPFSIGANAGITYTNGTSSFSIGGGYGLLSGPYGYFNGSQTIGDATVSLGFGGGSNYSGWNLAYTYKGYGIGYGRTNYGNAIGPDEIPNPQLTGTPTIYFGNGSFRLENDYFGDEHDRWRTNAWELSVGNFTLGSTIYTNNPEEMGYGHPNDRPSPLCGFNIPTPDYDYGAWKPGYVYSCPLWIGWRHGNSISRVGYSHPLFQDATQNFVHKYFPYGRMNFYIDYDYFYKGIYLGGGYYNPFSLY